MGGVAAVCPVHGAFRSRLLEAVNVENVTLSGNIEACPEPGCGRPARVVDGVFDFDAQGTISVRSAPAWSRQALIEALLLTDWTPAKVTQTVRAAKRAKVLAEKGNPHDAIQELAKSNRALGEAVQTMSAHRQPQGWSKGDVIALLGLLVAILGFLHTVVTDTGQLSEDDVARVVEQILQRQDPPSHPPTTDPPASQ